MRSKEYCRPAHSSPANFNHLARIYRWAEWFTFGPILSKCRVEFLPAMKSQQSALVIGDGDGRFTARLLQQNSRVVVDALDASEGMLQELKRRAAPNASRIHALNLDAREFIAPSHHYDLIATHFFLDCLTTDEVARLAAGLREGVAEGALWVVSDFAVPNTRYAKLPAQLLITALYKAFGILTGLRIRHLPDHVTALARSGFKLMQRRERLGGLLASELWQAY
ncbi:class I SAM-dependent methyltransferase [Telmatobacter sp. DSM 110680]|uniref:Class I SAM-dependent methyltransferase n=1 Tax=Telmatobacter sp. DSM 110680 TaxID=3036704 RepID=A0AAU7DR98_9BACT